MLFFATKKISENLDAQISQNIGERFMNNLTNSDLSIDEKRLTGFGIPQKEELTRPQEMR